MEGSSLSRIVYISTAVAPFTDVELDRLVEKAGRSNAARGITGMLCYNSGDFLQILEGADADIDELLETISSDPRHIMVQVLHRGPCERRLFADWNMGLCNTRFEISYCRSEFNTIGAFLAHCGDLDTDTVTLGLLNFFRKLAEGNAA